MLINSKTVIANEAKQSRMSAKSTTSGSPRHFVPRDDGINQRLIRETLNNALFVIVSVFAFSREAEGRGEKQSRTLAESAGDGSPRPFGARCSGLLRLRLAMTKERPI